MWSEDIVMVNNNFEMFKSLVGGVPSYVLVAAAVMDDNGLMMNDVTAESYLEMAERISEQMLVMDKPRFTLYDYLNACVDGNARLFDMYLRDVGKVLWSKESAEWFMGMIEKEIEKVKSF